LRQFDIPHEWPESVEDEADRLGSTVRTAHKAHRLDLRELPFVTIDGEDARDFDDAVYAEKTSTGWCLKVAIADVSHYVKPNSALDDEAKNRGTSVYFPEYVVPMLPEVLSNGLCSLKPKVDRLALVCEMQISRSGNITDFQFSEAVIRSHQRLTYTQVAKALVGDRAGERAERETEREHLSDLQVHIDELNALYQVLMAARTKRGAMEFESQEVRFEFNEQRKIQQIVPVKRNDAHRIIEECMLCANICAANFLEKNQVSGLFRVHLPPAGERLAALRSYLSELGLGLGGGDEPTTADYQQLSAQIENRLDKGVIQTMVLRSQQQAVYQPENRGHFGLAYNAYAHFTSPIRRYPDLLVHRAIRSRLRSKEPSVFVHKVEGAPAQSIKRNYPYNEEVMETLGVSCSTTERRAEDATRDVAQWLKCEYLQQHLGESFMGVVSSVTKFGLFIQMVDLYVEGLIHIANLPSDYYEYDAATQRLIGRSSKRTFKTGDKAMVQVSRVDLDERQIDLVLTDRPQQAASKPASANVKSKGQPSFSNRRQGRKDASGHTGNSVKSYDASVSEKIGEKVSKKLEKPTESRNLRNRAAKLARRSKGHTVDAKDGATVRRKNNDRSLTDTGKKSSKKPRIRKR